MQQYYIKQKCVNKFSKTLKIQYKDKSKYRKQK
jgi:hypothetical protein